MSQQTNWQSAQKGFCGFVAFVVVIVLFVSGVAALLYYLFSEYSGARNIWLLLCGAPLLLVVVGGLLASSLYTRYGKPIGQIVRGIDRVAEGDLSERVPEDDSPQFGRLISRFNKMVDELERADQQRRNLTADIAHELRTPLHIMQGKLEGMLDGVYEANAQHLQETLEETQLLNRLVEDLQTLSLAEAGALPLHMGRVRVAELLRDVAASFSGQAADLGIELTTELTASDLQANADYVRLNQVLANLVANALRHTPTGGQVTVEAQAADNGGLRIAVRDTGAGIPEEDLPFIFDRFWRGDRARGRGSRGREAASSGLGLAIARELVQAHGGRIEVESAVEVGTEFTIELPAEGGE
jgi:signal transduction histidine kinase